MTPCNPRSWSRWNLLVGLAVPLAGSAIAVAAGVEALPLLGVVTLVVLLDAGLCAALRPPPGDLALASVVTIQGGGEDAETGGILRLDVRLVVARPRMGVLLAPLVPPGTRPVGHSAVQGRLDPDDVAVASFRFQALRPGRIAFHGAIVRTRSPLRLFQRTELVVDRVEALVLPGNRASVDPRVARFVRSDMRPGGPGRAARAAGGTEFAELRAYRDADPLGHIDWKATARRSQLIVREYDSPRDFGIRVLLDASPDMAWGATGTEGFAHAADLLAQLSWVATRARIPLRLTAFDERRELDIAVGSSPRDHQRLLVELAELPHRVLTRNALHRVGDELAGRLSIAGGVDRLARRHGRSAVDTLLANHLRRHEVPPEQLATLVADLAPQLLLDVARSCPECHAPVFADEPLCLGCGWASGDGELSARTACLATLLDESIRGSRGRQMLLVVSSLQGGEACEPVARLLELAATGPRTVHLAIPTLAVLEDWRPTHPSSIADTTYDAPILRDMERLAEVHRVDAFRNRLASAGVHVHRLEDRDSLADVVTRVLLGEVLVP